MARIVVIIVLVIIAAGAGIYFFLYRGQSGSTVKSAGTQTNATPGESQAPDGTLDAQMAVSRAKLQLEWAEDKEIVKVVISASTGTDGRDIVYKYDWTLNGQAAGDGSDRLSGFKRGDRVGVKITPFDGDKAGQARFLDFLINNTVPRIAESKQGSFDGKTFTYQVKGTDPDGDPIKYSLEDAPAGMTIDPNTGAVSWQLKEDDYGERTFKVKLSDGKSGVTVHTVKVDLQKPSADNVNPDERK